MPMPPRATKGAVPTCPPGRKKRRGKNVPLGLSIKFGLVPGRPGAGAGQGRPGQARADSVTPTKLASWLQKEWKGQGIPLLSVPSEHHTYQPTSGSDFISVCVFTSVSVVCD